MSGSKEMNKQPKRNPARRVVIVLTALAMLTSATGAFGATRTYQEYKDYNFYRTPAHNKFLAVTALSGCRLIVSTS